MREQGLFSVTGLAEELQLDRRTIKARLDGVTPERDGSAHLYRLRDVLPLLMPDLLRLYGTPSDATLDEAKLRRETALAGLAELDLEERQGALIPATDVAQVWAAMISNARSRLLAIPVKGAPLLQGVTDLAAANEILKRLVYEALRELSETNYGLPEHEQAA